MDASWYLKNDLPVALESLAHHQTLIVIVLVIKATAKLCAMVSPVKLIQGPGGFSRSPLTAEPANW